MKRNTAILICIMFALAINLSFAQSSKTGKIIFRSSDIIEGQRIDSIYMANADGSELTKLTKQWFNEGNLGIAYNEFVLSPDCKSVALDVIETDLIRQEPFSRDIAIFEIDTGNVINLTNNKKDDYSYRSCWSPNGRQIAFERTLSPDYADEICIMNSDGSNVRKIADDGYPLDWSPDGRTIVFADRNKWGVYEIYTMDTNGGNVKMIVDSIPFVTDLRYSPDGKHIACNVQTTSGNRVYVMDSDGNNLKLLMTIDGRFYCWSSDGKKIAIGAKIAPERYSCIWLFDPFEPKGGVPEKLTSNDREEYLFDWRDPALIPTGFEPQLEPSISTWGYIKK